MKDGFIKVAAATPGIRVADVAYNTAQIKSMMEKAVEEGAKVVGLPGTVSYRLYLAGICLPRRSCWNRRSRGLRRSERATGIWTPWSSWDCLWRKTGNSITWRRH